jgi:thiol:disulfide interchange protein DsbD
MDKKTYSNQQVIEKSRQFLMLRADLTRTGSPEVERLANRFQILGVPTTVFVDPEGRERTELRKVGFVSAQELLDAMDKALSPPIVSTNITAAASRNL